jgi:flagellin-like protein
VRNLSRNRKAVSSVLGTILMILVVVVGMSMAFGYFVNFVKDYQTGRGASVMELVSIEDVWFKDGGNVAVWLYNYGKVDVKITTFYVNGQLVSSDSVDVPVGGHAQMNVQYPPAGAGWSSGVAYHLKLVTERGSAFEGNYTQLLAQRT